MPNTDPKDWLTEWKSGDIGFARSTGAIAKAIRFGERLRGTRNDSKWNHAFILNEFVNGEWTIFQAEAKGITADKTLSSVAPGGTYEIIPLPYEADRNEVLAFARSQVGAKYGFFTILSCIVDILLPDTICLRRANTWICSGFVAACLMFGGWTRAFKIAKIDLYTIMPSELRAEIAP